MWQQLLCLTRFAALTVIVSVLMTDVHQHNHAALLAVFPSLATHAVASGGTDLAEPKFSPLLPCSLTCLAPPSHCLALLQMPTS